MWNHMIWFKCCFYKPFENVIFDQWVTGWLEVVQHLWMVCTGCEHVCGSLSAHVCTAVASTLYHHSDQLSHHLHAFHWHAYKTISLNERYPREKMQYIYQNGKREQKRAEWTWVLRNTRESSETIELFSFSFHADCPRSTTYAIYSQSVHENGLMAAGIY